MNWKKHPPTCTCGKCVDDRASRESQKAIAQAKMRGEPSPPAPEKKKARIPNDMAYASSYYGYNLINSGYQYSPSGYAQTFIVAPTASTAMVRDQVMQRMGYTLSGAMAGAPMDTPALVTIDSIPEETDLVRGWRTYSIDARGRLKGSRVAWETAEFVAECANSSYTDQASAEVAVEHLLNRCMHFQHAGCGIYSHKVGPEYLKTDRLACQITAYSGFTDGRSGTAVNVVAQCISSGVVVEHEHGYRAEKCRIEQMWLVTPRRCANGHWVKMEPGQIGASASDWVRDDNLLLWVNRRTNERIPDILARDAVNPPGESSSRTTPPHWSCSETPVDNPGAAYAQVLATKYGVPCIAMPVAEFIAKLDEGSL